jgi:regulator of RNase E activity RraA
VRYGTLTGSRRSRVIPVFATGVVATPPLREQAGELDAPIRCGRIEGRPGDYVCGDSVVVPAELHDEILSRVDGR